MKFSIPKIRLASSVGIYLADHEISWCALEKGAFGVQQFQAGEKPSTKQDWAVELHKVLEPLAEEFGPSAAVVIGLPANHAFFATLPVEGGKTGTAEQLLEAHHCCSSIPPQELCADMLPVKVGGKNFAAVGASRRRDLQILTDAVRKLGFRYVRVEPARWALLRSTTPNPNGRMGLRLLVGGNQMLAALVVGQQPLLWRPLELTDVDSVELIVSLVRSFETYTSQHLGVASLDSIVLEGPNCKELAAKIAPDLGERFSHREGLGATSAAIAKGLALGGMDREKPAPDLARPLAPPPLLWDLIPRGEVALLGAVIVCLSLWLWARGTVIQNDAARIEKEENDRNIVLKLSDDALTGEKKQLSAQVTSVTNFLSNRIIWTEYLTQLSHRIPTGMRFVTILGEFELKTGSERNERKAKKNLIMDLTAMVPRSVSAPRKVDELLELIRAAPAIQRDFPDLKLSTLRVSKNLDRGAANLGDPATFTITCMPKGADTKPKEAGGDAKPAGGGAAVAKTE